MDILTLFFLAVGLSMDAMAVSISDGLCFQRLRRSGFFFISFAFGLFQGIMPIIGYFAGQTFSVYIKSLDHWIALILLGFIGGKMVWEAISQMRHPEEENCEKTFTLRLLLVQAVATSIDALAVGIGFAVMDVIIWAAAGFISITTFVFSAAGVWIGKKFGSFLKEKAELFGGLILISIGIKIFAEHMMG